MSVYVSLLVCVLCHVTVPHDHAVAVGLAGCAIAGQEAGAAYVSAHPGWYVAKTRCTIDTPPKAEDEL